MGHLHTRLEDLEPQDQTLHQQTRPAAPGREYYVALSGDDDANPDTFDLPFRTIAKGVSLLQPGDVLNLRHGVYVEAVVVADTHGTPAQPILIRSYPGEHAYIDGSLSQFRQMHNTVWEPAPRYDTHAHPDEYVSVDAFTDFIRGALLDRYPYTRLITYSRLEDPRATNETFERITDPDDPRPGPKVANYANEPCEGNCVPAGLRLPWVYMGPGIWIDPTVSPTNPQKMHIRLTHIHNTIPSLADYIEEADPRRVRLAIRPQALATLHVHTSSHLRFEHLTLLHGGAHTVRLSGANIVLDHVRLWASTSGVGLSNTTDVTFSHCQFNGGMPPWLFRSDITVRGNRIHARHGRHGIQIVGTGARARGTSGLLPGERNVATTVTATTLVREGAGWTENQWQGRFVRIGKAMAGIASNTADTLTLYVPAFQTTAWYTPLGAPVVTRAAGAYEIYAIGGVVDIDGNDIDCTDDGNGAGGMGIHLLASRAGMRARCRNNKIKNADTHAINVESVDANRPFLDLVISNNHAWDDQLVPTCTAAIRFTSPRFVDRLVLCGNSVEGSVAPVEGLDSGVWLVEEGLPGRWAGWGNPNGVIAARIGAMYQRLDPDGASALWVKQAADGQNIGWVEVTQPN